MSEEESKALAVKNRVHKDKKGSDRRSVDKDQCCKESGHWIKDCPNLKTPYDPDRAKKRNKSNRSDEDDQEEDRQPLAFVSSETSKAYGPSKWVADSGCTHRWAVAPIIGD